MHVTCDAIALTQAIQVTPVPTNPLDTLPDRMRDYVGEKKILDVTEKARDVYNLQKVGEILLELKIRRGMFPSLSSGRVTC